MHCSSSGLKPDWRDGCSATGSISDSDDCFWQGAAALLALVLQGQIT